MRVGYHHLTVKYALTNKEEIMAVVKDPLHSTDARGSVGGLTYSNVRGGNIVKRKSGPSVGYLPTQTRVRSLMSYLSRQWGELSDAQRASWQSWANDHPGIDKFGDPFIMSGSNAYTKLNFVAAFIDDNAAVQDLPPVAVPGSGIDALTVVTGLTLAGDIDVSWTEMGTGIAADFWEIGIAGPFLSPGKVAVESRYTHKQSVAGNVLLDTIEGLDESMWYWVRVRYVAADGQVGVWATGQATPKVTI